MCSIAAAKLHTLLQTRPVEKLNETCYVIAALNDILQKTLSGSVPITTSKANTGKLVDDHFQFNKMFYKGHFQVEIYYTLQLMFHHAEFIVFFFHKIAFHLNSKF